MATISHTIRWSTTDISGSFQMVSKDICLDEMVNK